MPLSPSLGRPGQYVPMADADVQIDHIVIGVRNLDAAQAQFEDRYGLTTIEGGRHPGWGTANRLVPLGAAYLELVTVVDHAEAAGKARDVRETDRCCSGASLGWSKQRRTARFHSSLRWGASTPLPGRVTVVHRAGTVALGELTVNGNEQRLHEWLGTGSLPIRVTAGSQGVARFAVLTSTDMIVVNPDDW